MSEQINEFVTGDTGRVIQRTITDEDSVPIDLSSAQSVKIRWKQGTAAVVEKAMTVVNGPAGVAEYEQQATDFVPGKISFEFEVITAAGKKITSPDLDGPYDVRRKL
jgi:hypothetical protein